MSFSVIEFIDQLVGSPLKTINGSVRHDMTFAEAVEYFEQQGLRYEPEERPAILEYDGCLGRDQAEKQAINELFTESNQLTIDNYQLLISNRKHDLRATPKQNRGLR